jgi:hypothetical protein
MKLYHEEETWVARLEEAAKLWKYARPLLDDGWRPLAQYTYDRRYVYAAAVGVTHTLTAFS